MLRVISLQTGSLDVTDSLSTAMSIIEKDYNQVEKESVKGLSIDWTGEKLVVYVHGRGTQVYRIEDAVDYDPY